LPLHSEQHVFVCLAIFAFHIPHVISFSILIKSHAFSARLDSLFLFFFLFRGECFSTLDQLVFLRVVGQPISMGIAPYIRRHVHILKHCTIRYITHGMENAKLLEHINNGSGQSVKAAYFHAS
jgi:hypothetical protein